MLLGAIWGSSYLVMRMSGPFLDPLPMIGVRLLSSALFYAVLMSRWKMWPDFRRHSGKLFWLAVFNTAVPFCLSCWGAVRLHAGVAALLNATVPLFASLFALLWLREHLHSNQWLGVFFGFAGVALLLHERSGLQMDFHPLAASATMGAAAMYGFCVNGVKRYFQGVDPKLIACGSTLWSAVLMAPLTCLYWPTKPVPGWVWGEVLWLGLMGTGVAYLLYFDLLARVGPTRASAVTYLLPLFAMFWGWLILHEEITRGEIACGALIALAVYLVNRRRC
ncbi:hypothetical protein ABS71_16855 [bacterium SCN 62-11]|nr:DMT family transporter [Candidatus Eremiobacteraeota bacterium]ODT61581.1 MAG: hypothetical protein ABS71_16855 [bacterium SCN 62-11]